MTVRQCFCIILIVILIAILIATIWEIAILMAQNETEDTKERMIDCVNSEWHNCPEYGIESKLEYCFNAAIATCRNKSAKPTGG